MIADFIYLTWTSQSKVLLWRTKQEIFGIRLLEDGTWNIGVIFPIIPSYHFLAEKARKWKLTY
jgi:hypothetical protein